MKIKVGNTYKSNVVAQTAMGASAIMEEWTIYAALPDGKFLGACINSSTIFARIFAADGTDGRTANRSYRKLQPNTIKKEGWIGRYETVAGMDHVQSRISGTSHFVYPSENICREICFSAASFHRIEWEEEEA